MGLLRLSDQADETLGQKIHHHSYPRGMAKALVGQQPQPALVSRFRRQAHDEVWIEVGDQAREHGKTDSGAHRGEQSGRGAVLHRHRVDQSVSLEP